ncbi:hypothetical protein GOP47_0008862 [Adiantum capillus-veneris]|uniref:Uncharacterized protein n=1 Tax=Adiantum capillus-veneris TaxID=13818 RepID=A0A9D4V0M1_ADICA|nr:hypothetical protein GOP47_0008862 [Adiantum capillus-veneris]
MASRGSASNNATTTNSKATSSNIATRRSSRFRAEAEAALTQAAAVACGGHGRSRAAGKRRGFDIEHAVCQSKLFDAFELQELQKQLDRTLALGATTRRTVGQDNDEHHDLPQSRSPCTVSANQEIRDRKSPTCRIKEIRDRKLGAHDVDEIKAETGMRLADVLQGACMIKARSADDLYHNHAIIASSGVRFVPQEEEWVPNYSCSGADDEASRRSTISKVTARSYSMPAPREEHAAAAPALGLHTNGAKWSDHYCNMQDAHPSSTHVHHHHHFHHHHHHIVRTTDETINWPFSPVVDRLSVHSEKPEEIQWPFSPIRPIVHFEAQEIPWPFSPVRPSNQPEEIPWPFSPIRPSLHFEEIDWSALPPSHQMSSIESPKWKDLQP